MRSAGSGGLEGSWRAKAAESRGACNVGIARQGVAGTMMPLVGGCGHRAGGQRLSSLFPLHSRAKSSRSKKRHGCLMNISTNTHTSDFTSHCFENFF